MFAPAGVTISSRDENVTNALVRRLAVDTIAVLPMPEIEDMLEVLHVHGVLPVLWHFPPA
jgi:hypothetical protein